MKGLRKESTALPQESLSSADGRGPRVAFPGLSPVPEPLPLPPRRARRPGAVPGLQTAPGRSVDGGAWVFSLQKTPIWRENSLYFSGAPQPPPSPVPYHFYADHTPDDELAAQLPAACLTREHQQAAGLALSSLLLLQPRGLGARVGVPAGPGCRRGARGRGVPPGSAHGAAPQPPCFLELCSFDPSGSPCHCTARAPSGSPRPRSLSSPPRSLSPQNEAARVLSPPHPRLPLVPRPPVPRPSPRRDLRGRRFWPARAPRRPRAPPARLPPARAAPRWIACSLGAEGIPGTRSAARER